MSEGFDIKQLIAEAKKVFSLEVSYGKLTAVEKTSIILSRIALLSVLAIIGCFALFYITSSLLILLVYLTGLVWVSNMIVVALLLIAMFLVYAFRKQLIIDPITRFITKLFLNPDNNE